jgi:hypothetical protein
MPAGNFLGNASLGDPVDGIKQANTSADEIGVMFRGVIFIPTYISAMGLKRSDL